MWTAEVPIDNRVFIKTVDANGESVEATLNVQCRGKRGPAYKVVNQIRLLEEAKNSGFSTVFQCEHCSDNLSISSSIRLHCDQCRKDVCFDCAKAKLHVHSDFTIIFPEKFDEAFVKSVIGELTQESKIVTIQHWKCSQKSNAKGNSFTLTVACGDISSWRAERQKCAIICDAAASENSVSISFESEFGEIVEQTNHCGSCLLEKFTGSDTKFPSDWGARCTMFAKTSRPGGERRREDVHFVIHVNNSLFVDFRDFEDRIPSVENILEEIRESNSQNSFEFRDIQIDVLLVFLSLKNGEDSLAHPLAVEYGDDIFNGCDMECIASVFNHSLRELVEKIMKIAPPIICLSDDEVPYF